MEFKNFWDWLEDWTDQSDRNVWAAYCLFVTLFIGVLVVWIGLMYVAYQVHLLVSVVAFFSPMLIGAAIPIVEYVNTRGIDE